MFCRKTLKIYRIVLRDLDWPLFQIMYFAKIVGFVLKKGDELKRMKVCFVCRETLINVRMLRDLDWPLSMKIYFANFPL